MNRISIEKFSIKSCAELTVLAGCYYRFGGTRTALLFVMKELPYFRFTVSEWLNGDIILETPNIKGVFIDVCAYYWFKDCNVSKQVLNKRFSGVEEELKQLFNTGIIKEKNNGNSIKINFLDEQYKILSDISSSRSKAGKASALKRATSVQQVYQQVYQQSSNYNYKDNNKDIDNTAPISKIFIPPTIEEVKKYLNENNIKDVDPDKWWNFYNAKNWMIGKNKMKNWKSAVATWHKKSDNIINGKYTSGWKPQ